MKHQPLFTREPLPWLVTATVVNLFLVGILLTIFKIGEHGIWFLLAALALFIAGQVAHLVWLETTRKPLEDHRRTCASCKAAQRHEREYDKAVHR